MSAVVEAVASVVSSVVETVGSAVQTVTEAVEDVGRAIDKNIIQPIKEDPISFAVQVAATSVGIPPPITAAAITAARGGDIEDIGRSAVAAYVAPQVGGAVGGAVAQQTAGSALQSTLSSAAGSAAASATAAAIIGQDIGESAILGGAMGTGADIARQVATSITRDTTPFTEQTQQLAAQEAGLVPTTTAAERVASGVTGAAVTGGDIEKTLQNMVLQEAASQLGQAIKSPTITQPTKTEQAALEDEINRLAMEMEGQELPPVMQLAAAPGTMTDAREVPPGYYVDFDGTLKPIQRIDITGVAPQPEPEEVLGSAEEPVGEMAPIIVSAPRLGEEPPTVTGDFALPSEAELLDIITSRFGEQTGGRGEGFAAEGVQEAETEDMTEDELIRMIEEELAGGAGAGRDGVGGGRGEAGQGGGFGVLPPEEEVVQEEELPEGEIELGGGEGEGEPTDFTAETPIVTGVAGEGEVQAQPIIATGLVGQQRTVAGEPRAISTRVTGEAGEAILGEKEPLFGGDEDEQRAVWNRRSLRLRRALGL